MKMAKTNNQVVVTTAKPATFASRNASDDAALTRAKLHELLQEIRRAILNLDKTCQKLQGALKTE